MPSRGVKRRNGVLKDFAGGPRVIIDWGREICGDLASAERREWLCTNGIGGVASGAGARALARRGHGGPPAAAQPPPRRPPPFIPVGVGAGDVGLSVPP